MKKLIGLLFVYFCFLSSCVFAQDLRFVQVSDINYSKSKDNEILKKFVQEVNKQKDIDFVVFSGNNIDYPDAKNLEGFIKEARKLKPVFYVVLGNKDVNKHKDLSKKQYAQYLKRKLWNYRNTDSNYIFVRHGVVFLVADGARDVIPTSVGYYKENVVDWIDASLDLYSKKNVVILQHFPLISEKDKENPSTFKPEQYLSVLENHKNVKAVVSGHSDINKEYNVNNIIHINTAPAPYYRIIDILNCDTDTPEIWAEVKEIE